jgi:hypothetical protein
MSLTGHLRDPTSPVRAWFADRLPNTTTIAKAANLGLRGAVAHSEDTAAIAIVQLRPPTRPPLPSRARSAALAGTALDLLVRATLAPHALQHSAAANGAGAITTGPGIPPAVYIERDAVERIDDLAPWERELDDDDWRKLAALCLLLGRFEQASRSRVAIQATIDQVAGAPPTLAGYRAALVNDEDLDDVTAVAPLIAADHIDLRAADRLAFGPGFALSGALGGADADLIADGLLLDFKATSMAGIVTRDELWQLDAHDIDLRPPRWSALAWVTTYAMQQAHAHAQQTDRAASTTAP